MFLFGRKNNASDAPAPPSPPATSAPIVPAASPPAPPSFVPPPPVMPVPVAESAPATDSTAAEVPFKAPRGVSPESRRQRQRVQRLKRELRVSGRSLIRQRLTETKPLFVLGSPLPEIAPAPLPLSLPLPVEEVPLPFVPEITPPEAATTAPVVNEAALKALVSSSPAFVEMQYELVDLRHQLQALQQAPAPEAKVEAAAPALDESALKALVSAAPAFVELQYELVDLRHQLQAMQNELAAVRASKSEVPAPITASQLAIVDTSGQMVANISAEGVVSCSSIVFMAQR